MRVDHKNGWMQRSVLIVAVKALSLALLSPESLLVEVLTNRSEGGSEWKAMSQE